MMDKIRNWWYVSNANKGTKAGYIWLGTGVAAFVGVWIFILTR